MLVQTARARAGVCHRLVRARRRSATQLGDRAGAIAAFEQARAADPEDYHGARLHLARLGAGAATPDMTADLCAPRCSISMRRDFDDALVERLDYRGPELLLDAVQRGCARPAGDAVRRHARSRLRHRARRVRPSGRGSIGWSASTSRRAWSSRRAARASMTGLPSRDLARVSSHDGSEPVRPIRPRPRGRRVRLCRRSSRPSSPPLRARAGAWRPFRLHGRDPCGEGVRPAARRLRYAHGADMCAAALTAAGLRLCWNWPPHRPATRRACRCRALSSSPTRRRLSLDRASTAVTTSSRSLS